MNLYRNNTLLRQPQFKIMIEQLNFKLRTQLNDTFWETRTWKRVTYAQLHMLLKDVSIETKQRFLSYIEQICALYIPLATDRNFKSVQGYHDFVAGFTPDVVVVAPSEEKNAMSVTQKSTARTLIARWLRFTVGVDIAQLVCLTLEEVQSFTDVIPDDIQHAIATLSIQQNDYLFCHLSGKNIGTPLAKTAIRKMLL